MSLLIIDDNFLSDFEIKEINKRFYEIPSLFSPTSTHASEEKPPSINDKYSNRFMYTSYDDQDKRSDDLGTEILKKFCIKNKIEYTSILRIRRNTSFLCNDKRPSEPHVDNIQRHLVFLYYINDSDGDTVLYKNKYNKRVTAQRTAEVLVDRGDLVVVEHHHAHQQQLHQPAMP